MFCGNLHAEIIYQSGSLGATGVSREEVFSQDVPGSNLASFNFVGVRFQIVDQDVLTSRIGGHFVGGFADSSFFGAIVSLTDGLDFPDSLDFSTVDIVGATTLTFPESSTEVFGDLSVRLEPGWYAMVFGSGLFGTTGRGVALANNSDIESPSYVIGQPDEQWFEASRFAPSGSRYYFVVEGNVIPEPTTLLLLGICGAMLLPARRRNG